MKSTPGLKEFARAPYPIREHPVYMFKPTWRWPKKAIALMQRELIPPVLHVPCGSAPDIGDLSIDLYMEADITADMNHLPIRSRSFNTVLSDPPWINPKQWTTKWVRELARVSRKRVIIRSGQFFYSLPRPWKIIRSWYCVLTVTAMVDMWYVWELENGVLED